MLVTLIPMFDENMVVKAYSLFTQKKNNFLNPMLLGTAYNDGVTQIAGLELLDLMGIETLAKGTEVFVDVNNISIFADLEEQCHAPHERLVLLMDNSVKPEEMYIKRLKELKGKGYKLAIRKLGVADFEPYREVLSLMDYVILNHKKFDITKAKIYFEKVYPNVSLIACNVNDGEIMERLKADGGYKLYEGDFYRVPMTKGAKEVAPLKTNYIELLNMVNNSEFELTEAADVIGRDTALIIDLLKIVNRMSRNGEIKSIRHAAAMLGQRELHKWINTAVAARLYADKPSEVTRLSLIRAKFAENLAPVFELAGRSQEAFLMGLFSVLDVILEKPMEEALEIVQVSKDVRKALLENDGMFAELRNFMKAYENADWQEIDRLSVIKGIDHEPVYKAFADALVWYRELARV